MISSKLTRLPLTGRVRGIPDNQVSNFPPFPMLGLSPKKSANLCLVVNVEFETPEEGDDDVSQTPTEKQSRFGLPTREVTN